MNLKRILIAVAMVSASINSVARAQERSMNYVQVAEIEIDPAQMENYKAAVTEQIETAIRVEPGVLLLYAVSDKENPTHVRVFEVYASVSAYRSHLETAHFKKYKTTTADMVKSLKLTVTKPIKLGAK
jgi:quinol monooxygenase YgiN